MKKSISKLSVMFDKLQSSNLISFNEVKNMKNVMGVYIIYSDENEILYIGSTNKFHIRFGTDLRHESTHTLIRKLLKAKIHVDVNIAREFFTNNYKYRIYECENKRKAQALEHIAIWIMNPKYNNNYLPQSLESLN